MRRSFSKKQFLSNSAENPLTHPAEVCPSNRQRDHSKMHSLTYACEIARAICDPTTPQERLISLGQQLLLCRSEDIDTAISIQLSEDDYSIRIRAAYHALTLDTGLEIRGIAIKVFEDSLYSEDARIIQCALCFIYPMHSIPEDLRSHLDALFPRLPEALIYVYVYCQLLAGSSDLRYFDVLKEALLHEHQAVRSMAANVAIRLGVFLKLAYSVFSSPETPEFAFWLLSESIRFSREKDKTIRFVLRLIRDRRIPAFAMNTVWFSIFCLDISSPRIIAKLKRFLLSNDIEKVGLAFSGLAHVKTDIPPWAIQIIRDLIMSDATAIRESVVRSLMDFPPQHLSSLAQDFVEWFVRERDLHILERILRLFVRVQSHVLHQLIDMLESANGTKLIMLIAVICEAKDDEGITTLFRIGMRSKNDPFMKSFIANAIGSKRFDSESFLSEVEEMLNSADLGEIEFGLICLQNAGPSAEILIPRLVELAIHPHEGLSYAATRVLQSIGSFAIRFLNSPDCNRFDKKDIIRLREYLEWHADEQDTNSADLSWVGDIKLLRLFLTVGTICKELGQVSQRQLSMILAEKKKNGEIHPMLPVANTTVRDNLRSLDEVVSTRYGREVALFVSEGQKPRRLSDDGIDFLRKCKKYLAGIPQ